MRTEYSKLSSRLALQSAISFIACLRLSAAVVTWNGDGGDASVINDANWVGGVAAPSGSDLVFGAETGNGLGLVQFDGAITFTAPTVTFTAAAPAYNLTAGSGSDILSITGAGTALSNLVHFARLPVSSQSRPRRKLGMPELAASAFQLSTSKTIVR